MKEILHYSILGNTITNYLSAIAVLICGVAVIYVFKKYILSWLKKSADATATVIDDLLVSAIEKSLLPLIYFGIFYVAVQTLALSTGFKQVLEKIAIALVTLLVVRAVISIVNHIIQSYLDKNAESAGGDKQLKGILSLINFVIWAIALVFLLDNLGVKISAVVAGLGIGGIAVALAAQAVLGDLFSYFVIFFDKPFEVGDFIIIGDKMGVVEYIGVKTTRIRAIGGEQLILSNTDLTNSRVHNFKKMERRRVVFNLGVTYQTSAVKLRSIPKMVKETIEKLDDTIFDRGHFASYGDFSLNFEFVYYVTCADYNKYMDAQQNINLAIYEMFEKEGIEFAYPTQTIFISKNEDAKN
ncbi:mechanosensitive ion channel family protein [Methylotenera sp.]|uniref:mechanosensitive ion channel family protein n=1 Tax=Methylotenera sp. TaxID=2051956 RepID=UPI0024895B5B|nr:mechanosensitive ion channel family protein [Methylotenera sp.]MDI1298708.1 mechanosensitive ion channel family protein [Methylotenera sp.]